MHLGSARRSGTAGGKQISSRRSRMGPTISGGRAARGGAGGGGGAVHARPHGRQAIARHADLAPGAPATRVTRCRTTARRPAAGRPGSQPAAACPGPRRPGPSRRSCALRRAAASPKLWSTNDRSAPPPDLTHTHTREIRRKCQLGAGGEDPNSVVAVMAAAGAAGAAGRGGGRRLRWRGHTSWRRSRRRRGPAP